MKFNLIRFVLFLILPIVIIGSIMFGVAIMEKYQEHGENFIPENPIAHESSKFSYQLMNPDTNQPLKNASVHLEVVKTKALNPWFYVGYLREDTQGTGIVYKTNSLLLDGKIEMESIFWDAGSYAVKVHATSPELSKPIDINIPVDVKVPLGQIIRTIIAFLAIFLVAIISGHIAGSLENPFKRKKSIIGKTTQTTMSLFIISMFLLTSFTKVVMAHDHATNPNLIITEKAGIQAELKLNPVEPVQKGEPTHFTLSFRDMKTGELLKGIDASISLYHVDDNLSMFTTRTEVQDGQYEFDYAFPDTATYKLVIHAAPNSSQSTLLEPFSGELTFEVPPVQPSVQAQIRAGTLMLVAVICGLVIGVVNAKRRKIALV